MRVLHINCNYTGTTLHQLLIEKLDSMGVENSVFVPISNQTINVINVRDNVTLSKCFTRFDRLIFSVKQAKIMKAIQLQYDISSFDCIHAYTLCTDGNGAYSLSRKYKVPYVVAVRNTDVNDFFRFRPWLIPRGIRILLHAKKIYFLSHSYEKVVLGKVPFFWRSTIRKKIEIIPNGIDDFWIDNIHEKQKGIKFEKISLIYAGRIDKNKNIPTIQKAMNILSEKGYKVSLTVVGKVVDENEFKKIIQDKNTEYYPAKPKEQLIDYYRNSDIFVMPSFFETFGLVYAEAMSQGLPVIYSKGQGFDEQFEEGIVGYHVSAKNEKDLAEKIVMVMENYGKITTNLVNMIDKFNWNDICKNYMKDYYQILDLGIE